MCKLQVVIVVKAFLTVGIFVINLHFCPKQDHRVPAEWTDTSLLCVQRLIFRPPESFAARAMTVFQLPLTNNLQRVPKSKFSEFCFEFVQPIDQRLNARHRFPWIVNLQ